MTFQVSYVQIVYKGENKPTEIYNVFTMVFVLHWLPIFLVATGHTVVFHPVDMGVGFVFEFFVGLFNLREICVSNMVIHLAGG